MMKKITYLILGIASFAMVFTGCKDPNEGSSFAIFEEQPIGLTLERLPDYSLWVEMMKRADIYNAMNIATKYTCFAVANSAVEEFFEEKNIASVESMDLEYLKYLMRYHTIVSTAIPRSAIKTGRLADTTATGDYLVSKYQDGNNIFINDLSKVVAVVDKNHGNKAVEVINGHIHGLEKMLDPIVTTLWEQIEEDPKYSIFTEAAELTGLNSLLNEKFYTVEDTITGKTSTIRRRLTFFSVSNDVFVANNINNLQDLIDLYGYGDTNYTDPSNHVYKFVGYHIAPGYNAFDDLTNFKTAVKKKNIGSFASNELIQLEEERGILHFNRDDNGGALLGTTFDVPARNGIRHDITQLMPLYTPAPTIAAIELMDDLIWPEWAGIAGYKGANGNNVTTTLSEGQMSFLRWQGLEGATVSYQFRSKGFGAPNIQNGHLIVANIGGVGWWEIDLPAIVKGRYRFTFTYHRGPGARGSYQPIIDGKPVGVPVNFFSTGYSYQISPAVVVFFPESGQHTLRFSQVTNGQMEINTATFTPVN